MTDKEIDNEQLEQEKYQEEKDEYHRKNYIDKKDKSLSDIETIQKSIQEISKKIE
jgi:hypothetical protein